MKQENILILLLLLWLTSIAGLARGLGRSWAGVGDVTMTNFILLLVIITMCRCLRDCARCCDRSIEEEEHYYETV